MLSMSKSLSSWRSSEFHPILISLFNAKKEKRQKKKKLVIIQLFIHSLGACPTNAVKQTVQTILTRCHLTVDTRCNRFCPTCRQLQRRFGDSNVHHGPRPNGGAQERIHPERGLLFGRCANSAHVSLLQHEGFFFFLNIIRCI